MNNLSKELVEMQILLRKYKVPQRSIDKIINREKSMKEQIDGHKQISISLANDISKAKKYIEKHQLNWFYKNKIKLPLNFDRYISNYTKCLLDFYIG